MKWWVRGHIKRVYVLSFGVSIPFDIYVSNQEREQLTILSVVIHSTFVSKAETN